MVTVLRAREAPGVLLRADRETLACRATVEGARQCKSEEGVSLASVSPSV